MGKMDIGQAIVQARLGASVCREGWNGARQFVYYRPEQPGMGDYLAFHPTHGPDRPWLASQADLLADDWYVVG